ncbi:MAG TPA: LytR C-terminal domain-containing protein [Acidimicrobiales bacterium]|nr:LytR C-terminal domain-containing protein [Acidimicrobiales bacterium]
MDVEHSRRSSPARGVAVIATAVIIGLFVLRNGFDQSDSDGADVAAEAPSADDGSTAATDGGSGGGGGGSPETTAAPVTHPAGEVTVLVANASGVQGAAGELSTTIGEGGYVTLEPTNAPAEVAASQVQYAPDFQADALALATAIGVPAEAVVPITDPPPVELSGAQVLVVLGPELATGG